MNIHYKTNMNTQHNEYQHVITKNVFKHNFLVTLNIFDVTSYKGSFFCCFNPSVSPLQLCQCYEQPQLRAFKTPTVLPIRDILSVSMTWPRKTPRFSSGFLVQSAKSGVKDQGTFPFLTASDSSGSTKSQPYLTSWTNWWVSYKQPQHSQGTHGYPPQDNPCPWKTYLVLHRRL